MGWICKNNFKDGPVVSLELVKFLTVNTGFEVFVQLVVRVEALKEANKDLTVKVSSNLKTSTNAAAKVLADLLIKLAAHENQVKVMLVAKNWETGDGDNSDGPPLTRPSKVIRLNNSSLGPENNNDTYGVAFYGSDSLGIRAKPPSPWSKKKAMSVAVN